MRGPRPPPPRNNTRLSNPRTILLLWTLLIFFCCGPAVAESQVFYCPYGQTDPFCYPWGTITALIHETEGGDLGKRIENGGYECEYEMLNYNTFRLESCENLINYEATATYPFTIPAGLNLSRALYAHLSFSGPGDSGGGTNIPSCANVRGWNCEEPVYYVNGVEMTDWFGAYGATSRFGWVDPAILHEGSNQLTITSKPLWSNIWIDGSPRGPFYTGRVDIDDVYVTIQTSYSPSEMPELLDLTINPDILLTTHDITISPVIKPGSPDWEIVGISYYVFDTKTGDMDLHRVLPDTGNLTYRPAPGNYGRKWLKAKMHVQERLTGHREISEITVPIRIYFEKGQYPNWVDDDANQLPNWFEYWMNDGAVPGLAPPVKYGPNMPGYGVSTAAGEVAVFPLAATIHYPAPLVIPSTNHNPAGESFGGPDVEGIDCVAEVVAHENYHKWVNEQWLAGGSFAGKTDSDYYVLGNKTWNDKLPDDYENTISLTLDGDTDSYLLQWLKHPVYEYYGDNEYMAMRAGNTGRGIPANDWAYPGKQANGSVVAGVLNPPAAAACAGGMCDIIAQSPAIGMTENPQDTNANGRYDLLDAGNDITIDWPGNYETVAILSGDEGSGPEVITTIRNRTSFANGTYTFTSSFQGTAISSSGIDGPYNVTLLLKHDMNENGEPSSVSWETAAYSSTDFEPVSAAFDGTATASPLDRNLSVAVPLLINAFGEYTIEGYLQDPDGKKIAHAHKTATFSTGAANAYLVFDGNAIAAHHRDGTYTMVNFRILDSAGTTLSRLTNAGTVTIDPSDFGTMAAILTDSYSASGDRQNSDGRYESLLFTAEITVPAEARYFYSASLFDEQGGEIQAIDGQVPTIQGEIGELSPGVQTLKARFSGADIYANRVNGTFSVRSLEVNGPPGSDIRSRPLTTVSFNYTDFASPPVMITGNVTDYPVDYNSDGMYDAIRIGFDVETGTFSSGTATIPLLGELTVPGANQTGIVNTVIARSLPNNQNLDQQMTHHVTLDFAGTDINGMGIDGPYDLTLLQAGKKSSGITPYYYPESYATADYDHTQFGPAALLMGTISDDIGRPLESVTIGAGGKTTTTNDAGFYRFYYATGGSTQVLVTPPPALNFSSDFRSVSFSTGSTTYANFSLFRPVEIHGTVTAENGTIIKEGAIIAEGPTTSVFQLDSWGNGSYRIAGQRNGTYDIRYTRVGGSDVIAAPLKDTYLTPGQSYEWNVVAYQRRSISGTVTDIYGDSLEEAEVSIIEGPFTRTWPSNAETDGSGAYSFLNLVPGNYTIEAEPPWLLRNDLIANTTSVTIGISDSTVTKNIVLMPEPAAPVVGDFISCDPGGGPPPLTVSFEDRASGYPTAWLWDFGDGDTSTERRPVHTYTDYGIYNITLTVSNDYGSNTSYFDDDGWGWIHVVDPPTPRVILPTGTLAAGSSGTFPLAATEILSSDMADDLRLTLRFDPSVVRLDEVTWNSTFSGQTLTADINNSTGEADIYILFWGWPNFMEPTDLVDLRFTATGAPGASSLLTADPATWENCYDGCISSTLEVTNGSITVDGGGGGAVPVPGFSSNTTSGSLPLTVAFDSSLSDALSPTAYLWTFGDGNTSALANPAHTYEIAGTYDVALQVTNSSGTNTTTKAGYITVTSPPSPALPLPVIAANTTTGTIPLAVGFSSAGSDVTAPTAYLWTFGDGNTSTLANPTHTYEIAGTYDVALQVTNISGTNTTTRTGYITVNPVILSAPSITSVTPLTGYRNSTIEFLVLGTDFQPDNTTAEFITPADGPLVATISTVTPTTINGTLAIPAGTAPGPCRVRVTTPGGVDIRPNAFTVLALPPPAITAISPAGTWYRNTSVDFSITGTGFVQGKTTVAIASPADGSALNATSGVTITGIAPARINGTVMVPHDAPATPWNVSVTTIDGGTFWKGRAFSVSSVPPPAISALTPASGVKNSTIPFRITGTGFQKDKTLVRIGEDVMDTELDITVESVAPTLITGSIRIADDAIAGRYFLEVSTVDGGSAPIKANAFSVTTLSFPSITSIKPAEGLANSTVAFVITGKNFQPGNTVVELRNQTTGTRINDTVLSGVSDTTITGSILIPPRTPPGRYRLDITTMNGGVAGKANAFSVSAVKPPTITSVTPAFGPKHCTVAFTVTGANFQDGEKTSVRFIDDVSGTILDGTPFSVTATKIIGNVAIPASSPPGLYRLDVTTTDGGTATKPQAFLVNYLSLPVITSISPASGPRGATTAFTLKGNNFQDGGTTVRLRGQGTTLAASLTRVDMTTAEGSFTIGAAAPAGQYRLDVHTAGGGVNSRMNAFLVTIAQDGQAGIAPEEPVEVPAITSVSPDSPWSRNSTVEFSIHGSGFDPGATTVTFHNPSAGSELNSSGHVSLAQVSPSLITGSVAVPAGAAAGFWNISVSNSGGGTAWMTDAFLLPEPGDLPLPPADPASSLSVTSLTPAMAYRNDTLLFSLAGTGFGEGGQLMVSLGSDGGPGELDAVNVSGSPDHVTGSISIPPTARAGPWDIIVSNLEGETVRVPGGVTIMEWPAPTVTAFSPAAMDRNETLPGPCLITGTGFQETGRTVVGVRGPGDEEISLFVHAVNQTTIRGTLVLPPGLDAGPCTLTVTTADGGTVTSTGTFIIH